MTNKLFSRAGLIVLAVTAIVVTTLFNFVFRGVRLDLTQDQLYTLAPGTARLLKQLPEPIQLKFYFSRAQTDDIPQVRNYARRIQELLREYVQASDGRVTLEVIDPIPFSEQEDEAAGYGLQAVPLSGGAKTLYMGLVAVRGSDAQTDNQGKAMEAIAFLSPEKERFLEYDISNLVYSVGQTKKPRLGLISALPVRGGGFDLASQQAAQPWVSISQLEKMYDVQDLGTSVTDIPEDITQLVLVLPELPQETLYAVDQYILRGGNALIFLDPQAESGTGGLWGGSGKSTSYLKPLLDAWGLEMVPDRFVADARHALSVNTASGRAVAHLGLLGYDPENFDQGDAVTGNLKAVNFASAGALRKKDDQAAISFEPLIRSSGQAALLDASQLQGLTDPRSLYRTFQPTGDRYVLAARVSGSLKTAFPQGRPAASGEDSDAASQEKEGGMEKTAATDPAEKPAAGKRDADQKEGSDNKENAAHLAASIKESNIILVSDTDVLSNRLWVQVRQFFGQSLAQPFANNGDMLVAMVDNLAGNKDVISIRSRGQFSRPFTRVNALERSAQARFLKTEEELNNQLELTENKLRQLQDSKKGQDSLVLSKEQTAELEKFQQEKLRIRKQLRQVQLQLNQEIANLGIWLKMLNILSVPVLLTGLALFWRWRRRTVS
ncbi:MAG: Gldg family protein [Kistimonas sp.]|nr:Gldg family protein [Kistimonas sp.]